VFAVGLLKPWHILVLVVVLLLLFGAKRLPDGARALGRSLRIFKSETKGLLDDDVRGKAEAQAGHKPLVTDVGDPPAAQPRSPLVEPRVVDARDER